MDSDWGSAQGKLAAEVLAVALSAYECHNVGLLLHLPLSLTPSRSLSLSLTLHLLVEQRRSGRDVRVQ